jgi:hypothetical protein
MAGDMQPLKRRGRMLVSLAAWIVIAPLCWGFFQFAWWLGVGLALALLWVTYDYIRKGDMAGDIEGKLSRGAGMFGKGAEEVLEHDDT